jgi:hypothetical protein
MIEAFHCQPKEIVVNRLYESAPKSQLWQGEAYGHPLTFYTEARNKFRGGGGIFLGKAGPQFMEGVSDYRCYFYRPSETLSLSIDDSRWASSAEKAKTDPDWTSWFPEEAFEAGVGVGPFAMVLDCPLDPRPVFPQLGAIRDLLLSLSDAVERVYLYAAGVGVNVIVARLSREKLLADVRSGAAILRLL